MPIRRVGELILAPFAEKQPPNTATETTSIIQMVLMGVLGLAVFCGLAHHLFYPLRLTEGVFYASFFTPSAVFSTSTYLLFLVGNAAFFILFRKQTAWSGFDSEWIRWATFALSAVLIWQCSTYSYNFFFDQHHVLDRLLIVVTGLLVVAHPIFLPIFLLMVRVTLSQFYYPLGGYTFTDKRMVIDGLLLFCSLLYLRPWFRWKSETYVQFLLVLISATYLSTGIAKLELSIADESAWWTKNTLHDLVSVSYHHGWLSWLSPRGVDQFVATVQRYAVPLQIATIVLEVGVIFLLANRRLCIALLLGLSGMHVGIFVTTGICFWKWFVVDVMVAGILVWRPNVFPQLTIRQSFVMSVMTIVVMHFVAPQPLGWWDTRLAAVYDVEVLGSDGNVYRVSRQDMSPYDVTFAQNRFWYLHDDPIPTRTWGATLSADTADMIRDVRSLSALKSYVGSCESGPAVPERIVNCRRFFKRWVANQRDPKHDAIPSVLKPPPHIWVTGQNPTYTGNKFNTLYVRYQLLAVEQSRSQSIHSGIVLTISDSSMRNKNAQAAQVLGQSRF